MIITTVFLSFMIFLLIRISLAVVFKRRKHQIPYGYGRNYEIADVVSAHSNFVAYAPLSVMLICILEVTLPAAYSVTALLAVLLFLGRLLHFRGLVTFKKKKDLRLRVVGMHLTLWPLLVGALLLLTYSTGFIR